MKTVIFRSLRVGSRDRFFTFQMPYSQSQQLYKMAFAIATGIDLIDVLIVANEFYSLLVEE